VQEEATVGPFGLRGAGVDIVHLGSLGGSARWLLPALVAAVTGLACGSAREEAVGQARLVVAPPSSLASGITRITLTVAPGSVTGQPTFAAFTADLSPATPWSVHLDGIPAGQGRVLTVEGIDGGLPPVQYRGSALVDVPAAGVVNVAIPLQPVSPPSGLINSAPVIDALTIDAVSVPIGATVALGATAHDPDPGDTVLFLWSTTGVCGTFIDTLAPQTRRPATLWIAPADPRTCRVDLTVGDGRGSSVSVYVDVDVIP
jgi:hypothetical protein